MDRGVAAARWKPSPSSCFAMSGSRFLGFVPLALLLGGCVTSMPTDLTVVAVEAVDSRNTPELHEPQAQAGQDAPFRMLIRVSFTSSTDLLSLARDMSSNLGNTGFLCRTPDIRAGVSYPDIFSEGKRIEPLVAVTTRQERSAYYVFVVVEQQRSTWASHHRFDLRQHPEDVCFYVRGGNSLGLGYKSNVVVILGAVIAAALRHAPSE